MLSLFGFHFLGVSCLVSREADNKIFSTSFHIIHSFLKNFMIFQEAITADHFNEQKYFRSSEIYLFMSHSSYLNLIIKKVANR